MNFKKVLATILAAVLLVVLSVSATIAYLTVEADPKLNVFTVGDIDITLKEEVGAEGGAVVTPGEEGAEYDNVMPGDKLIKIPTVTNTGENPAYVKITVTVNNADLINKAIDEFYENKGYTDEQIQAVYDKVFQGWGINYNPRPGAAGVNDARGVIDGTYGLPENVLHVDFAKTTDVGNDTYLISVGNWFMSEQESAEKYSGYYPASAGYYTADMGSYEIKYTYYAYLEADESVTVFEGLNVPADFNREQLAMFEDLNIKVEAAAIQATNMPSAKYAFAALAGDVDPNGTTVTTTAELEAALASAKEFDTIVLAEGTYTDIVNINGTLNGVTIDANGNSVYLKVNAGADLTDVTITNLVGDGALRHVDIAAGSVVKNLTITNSTLADQAAAPYGALYCAEPTAEITVTNCVFDGCRYAIYGSTPVAQLTFEDCTFKNFSSWIVMLNGSDTVGARLTINNCTMDNCPDGIAKYLGSSQPEGAATVFTNNTLTNCKGHDGSNAKWFTIPGAASTITVSGNTLDGAEWVPGTAQGLGK